MEACKKCLTGATCYLPAQCTAAHPFFLFFFLAPGNVNATGEPVYKWKRTWMFRPQQHVTDEVTVPQHKRAVFPRCRRVPVYRTSRQELMKPNHVFLLYFFRKKEGQLTARATLRAASCDVWNSAVISWGMGERSPKDCNPEVMVIRSKLPRVFAPGSPPPPKQAKKGYDFFTPKLGRVTACNQA